MIDPVMPMIRKPESENIKKPIGKPNNSYFIVAEYFFYSKLLKEEFTVYISKGRDIITLEFYQLNGKFLCQKDFLIEENTREDLSNNSILDRFDFELSRNGRYLLIYKCYKRQDETRLDSDQDLRNNGKRSNDWEHVEAEVYEIVLVRTRYRQSKMNNIIKRVMVKIKDKQQQHKNIRKQVINDVNCELKKIRTVVNLEDRCDKFCQINITDIATVTSVKGKIIFNITIRYKRSRSCGGLLWKPINFRLRYQKVD
jgi:hypothetical protein